jgi:V/A-type H+/Na+-transporting ATPase subunit I
VLSPEPMRHLTIVVLASELEVTTRAIARVGVLHLLDVHRMVESLATIRPYDMSQQLARLDALAHTLDSVLAFFDIAPPEPGVVPEGGALDLRAVEGRAAALAEQAQQLRQRLREATDQGTQVEHLSRNVRALAPLGLPLDQLRGLRYVHLTSGLLPERNLPRLHESLARVPHVIAPTGKAGPDGRILVAALCLRHERDVLERAARSAQLEAVELPVRLSGTPEEITAQLQAQFDAQQSARAALEAERHENGERVADECRRLRALVERERLLVEAQRHMAHSERTALIAGWVPAVLAGELDRAVYDATGGRCVLRWADPAALDAGRRDRFPVPILLHNAVLVRPFESLLRAYGLPRYGDVEPTAIVAIAFLTMFGFMFGDVGQGLVLFGIGYFIYRRMFRYRDYAVILMECGVFATAFGFLYGTVFGSERFLPALWLRPMADVGRLVQTAIAFGIVFLSIGLLLNLVNAVRRRDSTSLWERNGLLAALAYWTAVGLLIRQVTGGPGAVTAGTAMLWLGVPIALILLKEPARALIKGVRERHWPGASDLVALAVESVVEVLDTAVSAVSNTATFIRLAAFALSHAGLFLATFSVADAVAQSGGAAGTVGALLVLVLGNIVIIALEGLIVAIQSVRLEYYEFFSKFYSAGGEEYRPLRFGSAQSVHSRVEGGAT